MDCLEYQKDGCHHATTFIALATDRQGQSDSYKEWPVPRNVRFKCQRNIHIVQSRASLERRTALTARTQAVIQKLAMVYDEK